jgi:hypothetical protein
MLANIFRSLRRTLSLVLRPISVLEMVTGIVRFHIEVVCPFEKARLAKSGRPSIATILQQQACDAMRRPSRNGG